MVVFLLMQVMSASAQFNSDNPSSLVIGPPPMIMDDIHPDCWNFTYGNWRIQEFYSPNYPKEYLNNTNCVLYLEAPSGFRIQLDFRDKFVLEQSENCKYDFLEVRDGPFAYSPVIGRYCGAKFPPLISSSGRYLWMHFQTDELLQYGGFRAIYSYVKDNTQNDGTTVSKAPPQACRIPVQLSPDVADGVLTSSDVPYGDASDPLYPKRNPVDCTWEIYTDKRHKIQLRSSKLQILSRKRCDVNNVTIYDGTTLPEDVKAAFCQSTRNKMDVTSSTNRVFVRIYGNNLIAKPDLRLVYTLVRKGNCLASEIRCGSVCLPPSLRCNGVNNCQDKSDEKGCFAIRQPTRGKSHSSSTGGSLGRVDNGNNNDAVTGGGGGGGGGATHRGQNNNDGHGNKTVEHGLVHQDRIQDADAEDGIPLLIIILGAVGGVILTCAVIALCVMCRLRKHDRKKREELNRQKSAQRNALEMAVCNSSNTTQSLSRQQNEKESLRQGPPSERHPFYPMMTSAPPGMKDSSGNHRYSFTSGNNGGRVMMDDDDLKGDEITESNTTYNRYLPMEMTPDTDLMDSHPNSIYPMNLTTLDQRMTDGYGSFHSNQWSGLDDGPLSSYPYSNSSLTRKTPFLGLSKSYYNSPESKYLKAMKTLENETIKEHQNP